MVPASVAVAESDHDNAQNDRHFQQSENQLELASFLDAEIIEQRNKHRRGDGNQLSISNAERLADHRLGEERKHRKRLKDSNQPRRNGRNRRRLGDQKPGPGIQKSSQRPVTTTNINILAARLRLHRPQLRIAKHTEEREQPTHDPCQINQLGRPDRLHHLSRDQKDSAPNDGANDNRARMTYPKIAGEFGTGLYGLDVRRHSASGKYKRKPENANAARSRR